MGWLLGDKDAVEAHREAKKELNEYYSKTDDDEYLRRNARVIDTEKDVPWWRR